MDSAEKLKEMERDELGSKGSDFMLLLFGGFMYLDENLQPVGTNAVAAHSITPGAEIDGAPLELEKSADLPEDVAALDACRQGMYHFRPTTVQLMRYVRIQITLMKSRLGCFNCREAGATKFCWVPPHARIGGRTTPHGGFAYLFPQDRSKSCFLQIVVRDKLKDMQPEVLGGLKPAFEFGYSAC